MIKAIRYIFRYIKIFKFLTYSPVTILEDELLTWTDGDRKNLAGFFESDTGTKFERMLKNIEARTNAVTVINNKSIEYNSGVACGSRAMLAHVFALSAVDPQPQGDEYEVFRQETGFENLENLIKSRYE